MEYVIFSIDDVTDLHTLARFLRMLDEKRAMQKLQGKVVQCVGSYKGKLELSFVLLSVDFETTVRNSGYVDNQESILMVSEGNLNRQYAFLSYLKRDIQEYLGVLKSVQKSEAMQHEGWTYRPDLDIYWIVS